MNFTFDDRDDRKEYFHQEVLGFDRRTCRIFDGRQFCDRLTMIYLEMFKFNKQPEELVTDLDRWLYVLKNLARLNARPQNLTGKIFDRLFDTARVADLNPDDRAEYQLSLKKMWDREAEMSALRSLGKEESLIAVAQFMLIQGKDPDTIAKTTGIPVELVRKARRVCLDAA